MNPVAAILDSLVLYRHSLVLALAAAAGICFFMACCCHVQIPASRAAAGALTGVLLSLPLSRLVYWYGRPDSFSSLTLALTCRNTEAFALAGTVAGCGLAALLTGGRGGRHRMLDCMCVAGCAAIALGRLSAFFSDACRGQVMTRLTGLPWAYPVATASGHMEYRFATFLAQAAAAAVLGLILLPVFLRKRQCPGEVTVLFLLMYSASQILLDSTRYDSLYLHSNGFVSMVQVLSAAALVLVLLLFSLRALKIRGFQLWMIPLWLSLAALLGATGYMEYYVQRHGREAAFAYSVMAGCLAGTVLLGLLLRHLSRPVSSV